VKKESLRVGEFRMARPIILDIVLAIVAGPAHQNRGAPAPPAMAVLPCREALRPEAAFRVVEAVVAALNLKVKIEGSDSLDDPSKVANKAK